MRLPCALSTFLVGDLHKLETQKCGPRCAGRMQGNSQREGEVKYRHGTLPTIPGCSMQMIIVVGAQKEIRNMEAEGKHDR